MRLLPLCLLALATTSASASAFEPAPSVREGHYGLGLGGGTAVSGLSGSLRLANAARVQGVVGGAGYSNSDFGSKALGVNVDFLLEMPPLAHADGAFDLAWCAGVGGRGWIGTPTWLGANAVLGLEFNLEPAPVDIVLEYRPALRVVPDVGFELVDFGAHVRFYFD